MGPEDRQLWQEAGTWEERAVEAGGYTWVSPQLLGGKWV